MRIKFQASRVTGFLAIFLLGWMQCIQIAHAASDLLFINDNHLFNFGSLLTMAQDRQGFIWGAKSDVLMRYDGYEVKLYEKTSASIGKNSSYKLSLLADRYGRIWLGSANGLAVYEPETEIFKTVLSATDRPDLGESLKIVKLIHDDNKGFWLGTRGGVMHFKPDTEELQLFKHDPNDPDSIRLDNIEALALDPDGGLWIATWPSGLDYLPKGSRKFVHYQMSDEANSALSNNIKTLLFDSRQRLWLGTEEGVFLWHYGTDWSSRIKLLSSNLPANFRVYHFNEDSAGTIWVATANGLLRWDEAKRQFDLFQHRNEDPQSLAGNVAIRVFSERSGSLFIITTAGMSRLDATKAGFGKLIPSALHGGSDLSNNAIKSIAKVDSERLWLGTWDGVLLIEPKTRRIIKQLKSLPDQQRDSPIGIVYDLYRQADGILWLGTRYGLIRYDPGRDQLIRIDLGDTATNYVNKIAPGADGQLWLGTGHGLIEYDPKTGIKRQFRHDPHNVHSLGNDSVITLFVDRTGRVWTGGSYITWGMSILDPITGQFQNYRYEPDNPRGLPSNSIVDLTEDDQGRIWLVSNQGISQAIKTDTGFEFKNFGIDNHAVTGPVLNLSFDATGKLWFTSLDGVSRFDPAIQQFSHYPFPSDFTSKIEPSSLAVCDDGVMYVGAPDGVMTIDPSQLNHDSIPPKPAITGISIGNQPLDANFNDPDVKVQGPIAVPEQLTLPWTSRLFSIRFSAMHYADPARNRYAYKLEGFDRDWVEGDSNNRVATYTNLDPGQYLFRAKASNDVGVWGEQEIRLPIVITPAYWQTVWFKALLGLCVGCLLLTLYLLRIRRLRRMQTQLEQQVDQRTRELKIMHQKALAAAQIKSAFLANMSHEIRTPMNAIIGMTDLVLESGPDAKQRNYLDKIKLSSKWLLGIVNDILDYSKLETGKLVLEHTGFYLDEIIQYLKDVTAPLLESKPLALRFQVDQNVPNLLPGDPLRLGQILLNFCSNAIKFTQSGSVLVRVQCLKRNGDQVELRFSVTDTGIGLSREQQGRLFEAFTQADDSTTRKYGGTGLGLSICKKLVDAMGGQIGVDSELNHGSCFYFTVSLTIATAADVVHRPETTIGQEDLSLLQRAHLLVVEDNPLNQELIMAVLANKGIPASLASNGKEAVYRVNQQTYTAVLMDCLMPVMDGYAAARAIRANPAHADLPIIAMTANVMEQDRQRCLDAGMNAHIGKPINWTQLFQTLADCIQQQDKPRLAPKADAMPDAIKPLEFPVLPKVNRESARYLVGNNLDIYHKMLLVFRNRHANDIELIRARYEAGDWTGALQLIHNLSGSINSVAHEQLAQLLRDMEHAIRIGGRPRLEMELLQAEAWLAELMHGIDAYFNQAAMANNFTGFTQDMHQSASSIFSNRS